MRACDYRPNSASAVLPTPPQAPIDLLAACWGYGTREAIEMLACPSLTDSHVPSLPAPPQAPIELPWLRSQKAGYPAVAAARLAFRSPGGASRARFRSAGPGPTVGPVRLGLVCALFCTLICSVRASRLSAEMQKRSRAYPALRPWRGGRRRWTPIPPSLTRLAVCDLICACIRSLRASRLALSFSSGSLRAWLLVWPALSAEIQKALLSLCGRRPALLGGRRR